MDHTLITTSLLTYARPHSLYIQADVDDTVFLHAALRSCGQVYKTVMFDLNLLLNLSTVASCYTHPAVMWYMVCARHLKLMQCNATSHE